MNPAIQKVELKTTAVTADEPQVRKLLNERGGQARDRDVYFYDTRAIDLFEHHLVLRARVNVGEDDDSTVKLRPLDLDDPPDADWRTIEKVRVEEDVVGDEEVPSAKLDGTPDKDEIEDVAKGKRQLDKLFSGNQEDLIAGHIPDGISLSDLAVLGPIEAHVWEIDDADFFPHKLGVEKWKLPDDGGHFYELSFKVDPGEAPAAKQAFRALLADLGIEVPAVQVPKTRTVLEFFAARA